MRGKNNKKSLQEIILKALSRKKVYKNEELVQNIETLLENKEAIKTKTRPKYLINRTLKKMIEDDMIKSHETEHSYFLSLTPAGRQKLRNIKLSSENHLVSTHWDGFWRMVIVDIPDNRKKEQDAVRYILKKAQFVQIKSSVWISPYPLEYMMINIKKDMQLENDLLVLVTNKLDATTEQMLIEKFTGSQEKEE